MKSDLFILNNVQNPSVFAVYLLVSPEKKLFSLK